MVFSVAMYRVFVDWRARTDIDVVRAGGGVAVKVFVMLDAV